MDKVKFEAELIEGHKGVTVVLAPFDPEERWSQKPVRLAGRRHGWLVAGSANSVEFDGYIGDVGIASLSLSIATLSIATFGRLL
jgi:hypothetical protein